MNPSAYRNHQSSLCTPALALLVLASAALLPQGAMAQADSSYSARSKRVDSIPINSGGVSTPTSPGAGTGFSLVVPSVQVYNAKAGTYTPFGPFTNVSSAMLTVTVIATNDNSVGCLNLNGAGYGCTGKGAALTMAVPPGSSFDMVLKDGERVSVWANQSGLSASSAGVPSAADFANPVLVSSTADPRTPCVLVLLYSDGSRVNGVDPSPICNPPPDPGAGGGG